jgi:hypothetical protein
MILFSFCDLHTRVFLTYYAVYLPHHYYCYWFKTFVPCHLNPLENHYDKFTCHSFLRNPEGGDIEDIALDTIFSDDDSDVAEDDSESDGYLSEVVKYIILLLLKNVF